MMKWRHALYLELKRESQFELKQMHLIQTGLIEAYQAIIESESFRLFGQCCLQINVQGIVPEPNIIRLD
jgi:hypothetical protein